MIKMNNGQQAKRKVLIGYLFDIMEFTIDRIENDKNLLLSLLKLFSMFKVKFWWSPREYEIKNTGVNIAISCSNCGKETMIDVDMLNTTYQHIITTFVLNIMLQHVGMLWIIEIHKQLQYDMD